MKVHPLVVIGLTLLTVNLDSKQLLDQIQITRLNANYHILSGNPVFAVGLFIFKGIRQRTNEEFNHSTLISRTS